MSRKNPDEQPDTESFETLGVDPDAMSAPDQAEVARLTQLRELAEDPSEYDAQLRAISDRYTG